MCVNMAVSVYAVAMFMRMFMAMFVGMDMFVGMGFHGSSLLAFSQKQADENCEPKGYKGADDTGNTGSHFAPFRSLLFFFRFYRCSHLCSGSGSFFYFRLSFFEVIIRQKGQFFLNIGQSAMDTNFFSLDLFLAGYLGD